MFWGAVGAIALRIVLTVFALSLLELPWLKLVGGLLLLWIGVKLIAEEEGEGDDGRGAATGSSSAVKTVIVADLVMSLDNVLGVAAAAKGSVIAADVRAAGVSIPLVIAGSQLILKLIERFPLIIRRRRAAGLHRRRDVRRGCGALAVDRRARPRGSTGRCRWRASRSSSAVAQWMNRRGGSAAASMHAQPQLAQCRACPLHSRR